MRTTNKIIIGVILVAVLALGIGYAAIQNITLYITGKATANISQSNFMVKYLNEISVSNPQKITATVTDSTHARINVEGLTAKGDVVTATYKVQNTSSDLSANLSVLTTNSNEEYFTITSQLGKSTLTAGEETTLTITIQLIKTPINDGINSIIGLQLTSEPVQPGQEGDTTNPSIPEGGITGGNEDPEGGDDSYGEGPYEGPEGSEYGEIEEPPEDDL